MSRAVSARMTAESESGREKNGAKLHQTSLSVWWLLILINGRSRVVHVDTETLFLGLKFDSKSLIRVSKKEESENVVLVFRAGVRQPPAEGWRL